jgi:hypothetical protein
MKRTLLILTTLFLLLPQAKANNSIVIPEPVGAIGDITVNAAEVAPELQPMVNIFNGAMGIIGVKNLTNGVANYAKQIPDKIKGMIRRNESIKQALFDAYLEWKVAVTNLDNLDDAEKQLIAKQEQVWRTLGVVDDAGGSKTLYSVDKSFHVGDEMAGVFKKGEYRLNPTATTINELTINPSGTVKGKKWLQKEQTTEELLNGAEYMYVIDENNRLIIGTRAQHTNPPFSTPSGKAPHPTLIKRF